MNVRMTALAGVAAILLAAGAGMAAVEIATVPVGNVENADDTHGDGYGGVDYAYNIGTCEISNAEYREFLNAVATVGDPRELYNTNMGGGWNDIGGIARTGSGTAEDPWVYSTRENRGNRPVNYVSFWDACRFANWLHNGQGGGNTEDGAYTLTADGIANNSVTRNLGWQWAVTSEDEWYKAAYHKKNDGVTGNYFDYPTAGDTAPTAEAPPGTDMTDGSANHFYSGYVDPTYYTTECGAYNAKPSSSPYGTYDQGGNLWEWNEAIFIGSYRGLRGGSFDYYRSYLLASFRNHYYPTYEFAFLGFRVSEVPEPATMAILMLGGIAVFRRRRCVQR